MPGVTAQDPFSYGFGFGEAEFSVGHHLTERLAEDASAVYGADPMQFGHSYAVGAVHELEVGATPSAARVKVSISP